MFTGDESENIELEDAIDWCANYRSSNPGATRSHFFGANQIRTILAQDNCIGIRAYHAIDDAGDTQLILVGVTSDEEDMCDGVILDKSKPCPPGCAESSPLNGE